MIKRLLRPFMRLLYGLLGLLKGMPLRILEHLGQWFPENAAGCKIRGWFYRPFLKRCGKNLQVGLAAKLEHLGGIEFHDDVYIGYGCWISGLRGGIVFEDQVMLGPYVTMVLSNHTFENGSARFGPGRPGAIRVGRGSWIAAHAVVVAGVTIGPSVLVAAGAVVAKDVGEGMVVGGVPAKPIGRTAEQMSEGQ